MVWRGRTTPKDKLLACLFYLVPILEVLDLGYAYLFRVFPSLELLFSPLFPLLPVYFFNIGGIGVVQLGIFLGLYFGVVRNEKLLNFLRYNAIQSILLGIFAILCRIVAGFLSSSQASLSGGDASSAIGSAALLWSVIFTVIFIFVVGASLYAIIQSVRGRYAEIPLISEAAYTHVR